MHQPNSCRTNKISSKKQYKVLKPNHLPRGNITSNNPLSLAKQLILLPHCFFSQKKKRIMTQGEADKGEADKGEADKGEADK
ncbi:hypothetical protein, partial [Bartonella tribocorum]